MTNNRINIQKYFTQILIHLQRGEFALSIYILTKPFPNWLFRFNKATILYTEDLIFPKKINPEIKIVKANYSDIDKIYQLSNIDKNRAKIMMDSGAKCYMASIKNEPCSSLGWAVNRKCFIRGIGFNTDFGNNGHYTFGLYTLPAARKQGLNTAVFSASAADAHTKRIDKFYSIVEFTNHYALAFHDKFGYEPVSMVTYIKILFLKICIRKNLLDKKSSRHIFIREPKGNNTVV